MSIISNIKNITSDKIFVIHGNEIPFSLLNCHLCHFKGIPEI